MWRGSGVVGNGCFISRLIFSARARRSLKHTLTARYCAYIIKFSFAPLNPFFLPALRWQQFYARLSGATAPPCFLVEQPPAYIHLPFLFVFWRAIRAPIAVAIIAMNRRLLRHLLGGRSFRCLFQCVDSTPGVLIRRRAAQKEEP